MPEKDLFQYRVTLFGLYSVPVIFWLLDMVLRPEFKFHILFYLADIIVACRTFKDHFHKLIEVFLVYMRETKLWLNPNKCHFAGIASDISMW